MKFSFNSSKSIIKGIFISIIRRNTKQGIEIEMNILKKRAYFPGKNLVQNKFQDFRLQSEF